MPDPLIAPARAQSDAEPLVIAVRRDDGMPRATDSHQHARAQLIGAERGLLTVGTETGRWVVPPGHAVWVPPGHRHSMRSHGAFAGWSLYVAAQACGPLPSHPCTLKVSALLREAVVRAASWADTPSAPQARLIGVMLDEIGALPSDTLGLPMPRDPRLLRIAQALADNPANGRALAAWAVWAAIPPRTMTRRFSLETGFSFTQWRQRLRLLRALEMLAAGHAVTAIAFDLGYDNVSAFIAMFRRTFGVTPTRYFTQGGGWDGRFVQDARPILGG